MTEDLRIFSYLPNPRLFKATIAARFSGATIEVVGDRPKKLVDWLWDYDARELSAQDQLKQSHFERRGDTGFAGARLFKTDAFLKAHPFGNVPAAFCNSGQIGIFESNSIMRAAARLGPHGTPLFGSCTAESLRVDSFLDRSLVFARDLQRYLLARETMTLELYSAMKSELGVYAAGLDRTLEHSTFIVGDEVTLADICIICDMCQLTYERVHEERFEHLGVEFLLPLLGHFERIGEYVKRLSSDERFTTDLSKYFEAFKGVWE